MSKGDLGAVVTVNWMIKTDVKQAKECPVYWFE